MQITLPVCMIAAFHGSDRRRHGFLSLGSLQTGRPAKPRVLSFISRGICHPAQRRNGFVLPDKTILQLLKRAPRAVYGRDGKLVTALLVV